MDRIERQENVESPGHWEERLSELHIAPRDADRLGFSEDGDLRLDGLLHLAGMVGAGKSTLMTLIAVWGARQEPKLRTTIVVGDVAEQLRLSALLRDLGLAATPVLGLTTRETHVQRLHRRLASRGLDNLLDHDVPGFDDLSTVCVVNALRGTEAAEPLRFADAPCTSLYPEKRRAEKEEPDTVPLPEPYWPGRPARPERAAQPHPPEVKGTPHGCPLWYACPRHRSARELVDAQIWVANPASLVQTSVPRHLGDERLRHLELACLRSDIIIVDEADSVQMKLDEIFAPSATLVSPGPESWLDQLQTHRIEELSRQGRLPLTDQEIERWSASLTVVHAATDRLYKLLISDEELREWADMEYFSPWTLQEKLLGDWFAPERTPGSPDGVADEAELYEAYEDDAPEPEPSGPGSDARRSELTDLFDTFRDDPLGGLGPYGNTTDDLVRLVQDLLATLSSSDTRARVLAVLRPLLADSPAAARAKDETWLDLTARRLEFMLLLSALNHRLDRLVFLWPQVEAALHLDSTGNELSRRPPLDYAPLVPEAPMGNVLGFQYLPDDREQDVDGRHSGTLRFFRCAGVGRELLLSLHEVGADPGAGRRGPHVVLMSGTSWAGSSTRAHVLAPVGAVLKPSPRSLEAVSESVFTTHFLYDDEGRPMSLSGTEPKTRPAAARALASRLGSAGRGGAPSPLSRNWRRSPTTADGGRSCWSAATRRRTPSRTCCTAWNAGTAASGCWPPMTPIWIRRYAGRGRRPPDPTAPPRCAEVIWPPSPRTAARNSSSPRSWRSSAATTSSTPSATRPSARPSSWPGRIRARTTWLSPCSRSTTGPPVSPATNPAWHRARSASWRSPQTVSTRRDSRSVMWRAASGAGCCPAATSTRDCPTPKSGRSPGTSW